MFEAYSKSITLFPGLRQRSLYFSYKERSSFKFWWFRSIVKEVWSTCLPSILEIIDPDQEWHRNSLTVQFVGEAYQLSLKTAYNDVKTQFEQSELYLPSKNYPEPYR